MDTFSDQVSKNFENKEWLVRIDSANSRPYLFKFHCSAEDHCSLLVTDTANVWFEAINSKQLARRWRRLNTDSNPFEDQHQEHAWRTKTIKKLSSIHTITSVQECVFSIEDSPDADLAIELQALDCKWRWECYSLGLRTSAQILSKHLILPLLSTAHLAFTSADPVSELSPEDLQQAIDKVAKTGRRAKDVFVRQTMSRPRVATTLARMTAIFNFSEPIPLITDGSTKTHDVDIDMEPADDNLIQKHENEKGASSSNELHQTSESNIHIPVLSDHDLPFQKNSSAQRQKQAKSSKEQKAKTLPDSSSATEPDSADEEPKAALGPSKRSHSHASSPESISSRPVTKKATLAGSKHSDLDADGPGTSQGPTRARSKGAIAVRVRQPIKRGGRRF